MRASAILAICLLFAILMGCLAVVACTWDTPYRVSAIAWMAGGFAAAAVIAALYRASVVKARSQLLASVRRQWDEDRILLERILSSDED
jgi:uncharacterized membrane protein YqjE